ncbi:UDP-N-acetylmuramoyl-L-alanine--D-glutamate ligase [Thiohalobacter sp. IOR34]|uniref:UDP-N-acetylmuramoyl-L-alanine--D-glutamate ligase n=1 Tax=Thiohalobacter sp. IOR34 TaxID=3057176 RepID=UPI0025B0A524|nr:UDP-N-acetylmuramoyl-L-alanine--D-glutamate ligase [Thiohalobacter sp. IOR34]WJW75010.1 UDP-N-acetylmuramoyl-L-alanine--D-glutamate ligase [Thiohalobacter sp. IOR34]
METGAAMHAGRNAGRKVLVVGLGRTGLSCARFLARHGMQVAVTDTAENPAGLAELQRELPEVALFLGRFDADAFRHAEQILVSPGVSLRHPLIEEARSRGVEVIGDIELFARHVDAPVVAITGSNGKSTVTTLVYDMARRAGRRVRMGGNIGIPALDLLDAGEVDLFVLELSSFQLETLHSLQPAAAVVLNVSPDHMDRYSGLDEYAAAKARIYRNAGLQVVNLDDPAAARLADPNRPQLGFRLGTPVDEGYGLRRHEGCEFIARGEELLLPVDAVRMAGRHNLANALAALALGEVLGLPAEPMLAALREFGGLPHRTQWLAAAEGVDWYNDSKATNVGATLAAISGFEERPLVLIMGGQGKGADFSPLREAVCGRARAVVLLGEDAAEIEAALGGCVPVQRVADMRQAVETAARLARPGDAVLLSPACASFDMFEGYEDRGRRFAEALQEFLA